LILAFLLTGMWIFVGLGAAGIVSALLLGIDIGWLRFSPYTTANSFTLTAVGTFIIMGEFLLRGGVTEIIYSGASVLFQRVRGSLYYANIVAATIFGACSGSSVASSATIGSISIPQLDKRGYNREIAVGTVAGAGLLGNLIPPSITFIIYGSLTGESVGRLFMAGIIPGLLMSAMMLAYIAIRLRLRPDYAPVDTSRQTGTQILKSLLRLLPIVALVFIVLGSIYSGFATPTEAGAIGALFALVLAGLNRKLSLKLIKDSAVSATLTTCMIMILIVLSAIPATVLSMLRLSQAVMEWTASANLSPLMVLAGVAILYIILGLFIDTTPVMVMTLGTIYPLMMDMGFDGIWLGLVITLLALIGMITPPVGICLYTTMAVAPGSTLKQVSKGALPFAIILLLGVVMLTLWPQLALWLPSTMFS